MGIKPLQRVLPLQFFDNVETVQYKGVVFISAGTDVYVDYSASKCLRKVKGDKWELIQFSGTLHKTSMLKKAPVEGPLIKQVYTFSIANLFKALARCKKVNKKVPPTVHEIVKKCVPSVWCVPFLLYS